MVQFAHRPVDVYCLFAGKCNRCGHGSTLTRNQDSEIATINLALEPCRRRLADACQISPRKDLAMDEEIIVYDQRRRRKNIGLLLSVVITVLRNMLDQELIARFNSGL